MSSRIYLAILGISIAVMAFFNFYSWSWLQSIGQPESAVAGYEYHTNLSWTALWLTTVLLFAIGNAVLWGTSRAWAMWTTFVYFSVFVAVKYFWLGEAFFHFKKDNGLFDGSFSVGPFFAVLLIALMAVIVFFDKFIVLRLKAKTYPPIEKAEAEPVKTAE